MKPGTNSYTTGCNTSRKNKEIRIFTISTAKLVNQRV